MMTVAIRWRHLSVLERRPSPKYTSFLNLEWLARLTLRHL